MTTPQFFIIFFIWLFYYFLNITYKSLQSLNTIWQPSVDCSTLLAYCCLVIKLILTKSSIIDLAYVQNPTISFPSRGKVTQTTSTRVQNLETQNCLALSYWNLKFSLPVTLYRSFNWQVIKNCFYIESTITRRSKPPKGE